MSMLQSMFSPSSFGTATKIEGLDKAVIIQAWVAILLAVLWILIAPTTQGLMRIAMRSPMYRPYVEHATALVQFRWQPTVGWVIGSAAIFAVAFLGLSRVTEFIYYNF